MIHYKYLVSMTDAMGHTTGYAFDAIGNLTSIIDARGNVTSYGSDALNRRISKTIGTVATVFLYDNARIIEERDAGNNVQATYTYGNYIDEAMTMDSPGSRYYYHQNTLWSVHAITDATCSVIERYTYDAYGKPSFFDSSFIPHPSSLAQNPFLFTGREWDTETSLYHYRARTYSPTLGRFLTRDPLGYVDGMNLYEYVMGRPVRALDHSGLAVVETTNPYSQRVCLVDEHNLHRLRRYVEHGVVDFVVNQAISNSSLWEMFTGRAGRNVDRNRRYIYAPSGWIDLQHLVSSATVPLAHLGVGFELGVLLEFVQLFTHPNSAFQDEDIRSNFLGSMTAAYVYDTDDSIGEGARDIIGLIGAVSLERAWSVLCVACGVATTGGE